jgi:hypothetical protein
MFNGSTRKKDFKICDPLDGKKWVRSIDTGLEHPDDILLHGNEQPLKNLHTYTLKERSMAVLVSRLLY